MRSECFNPELTINSGQMFLWQKKKDAWYGIHADHVLKLSIDDQHADKKKGRIKYDSFPEDRGWEKRLFRMDDDIDFLTRPFEVDADDTGFRKFLEHRFADQAVLFQVKSKFFPTRKPARFPRLGYLQSETCRINFLSHIKT